MSVKKLYCLFFTLMALMCAENVGAFDVITLSQPELTVEPHATAALTATVPSSASAADVTWMVINNRVVTLDKERGASVTLRGVAPGKTMVIARLDEASGVCTVTVSGIFITPETLELEETQTQTLRLSVFGKAEEVSDADWTWSSDNADVATVEKTGTSSKINAVGIGTATITCTNGTYSATCAVTVKEREVPPASVELSQTVLVLEPGETSSITAASIAEPQDIKWSMGDTDIASMEPGAGDAVTVTGIAVGRTTLTAQVGAGPVARCIVIVSGITFASNVVTVEAGKTLNLTISTYGPAASVPLSSWEWVSSDTSVATVTLSSAGGVIRGIRAGIADVSVTVGDYTASCQVKVESDGDAPKISLSESTITMEPGESTRLRATTIANSADIKWYIENQDITQIATKNGYVVILAAGNPGQTTIIASVGAGEPASCTVIISGFTLSGDNLSMTTDGSEPISLSAYGGAKNYLSQLQWTSSDASVATVTGDANGATVQPVGTGRCTVACTSGPYRAVCQVSVEEALHSLVNGSAVRENNGVSVTCWYPSIAKAADVREILCAVYDKSGALLALELLSHEKEVQTALIPCDAAQAERVKLFCFGDNHAPVGSARVLTFEPPSPSA